MAIEVASEVFAEGRYGSNEHVIIVDATDGHGAGLALARAGGRFSCVTDDGRELSEDDDDDDDDDFDDEVYTPNYVSRVHLAPRGPWLYVDCKGAIPAPMRERMIAVLVEELQRLDVSARVEVPAEDERDYSTPLTTWE